MDGAQEAQRQRSAQGQPGAAPQERRSLAKRRMRGRPVDIRRVGRARDFMRQGWRMPRQPGRTPAANGTLCLRAADSPVSRRRGLPAERGRARRHGDGGCNGRPEPQARRVCGDRVQLAINHRHTLRACWPASCAGAAGARMREAGSRACPVEAWRSAKTGRTARWQPARRLPRSATEPPWRRSGAEWCKRRDGGGMRTASAPRSERVRSSLATSLRRLGRSALSPRSGRRARSASA